jgi:hypothetical protein
LRAHRANPVDHEKHAVDIDLDRGEREYAAKGARC